MSTTTRLLGGGWLWLQLPAMASLSACARDAARSDQPFVHLTPLEGRSMRAVAARMIPSEPDSPGAEEAGVAWFADALVGGPMAGLRGPLGAALAEVDERAQAMHGAAFADLEPPEQDGVLVAMEADDGLFGLLHFVSVSGFFADAVHGGRGNAAALALLGVDGAPAHQPPFGWYDARAMEGA